MGSSPLTRGAPWAAVNGAATYRIIPAHAGSTAWCHSHDMRSSDHPRSRGEHAVITADNENKYGSSPLTRGAL